MIVETPAPAKAVTARAHAFQVEFDWTIGHARPWLLTEEVKKALECSDDHVWNLFDDGSIDVVIDIRSPGARRPAYRVLRESFYRLVRKVKEPTNLENVLAGYLRLGPSVLRSFHIANHFNCSERHVCEIAPVFFTDISPNSSVQYVRATGLQLIEFAKKRRIA